MIYSVPINLEAELKTIYIEVWRLEDCLMINLLL